MNQVQIRVVRDALEGKFNRAIDMLTTESAFAVKQAVKQAEDNAPKVGKLHIKEARALIAQLNAVVRSAEADGLLLCNTKRGGYREELEVVNENLYATTTDDADKKTGAIASAPFDAKIEKLNALREQTYLSLYDTNDLKLMDVVSGVLHQIATILS